MFGKIVAISTVKHLSRNYASFSNQVCKSGIAYPLLVRRKVFSKEIPLTFMEMDTSCRTQASRKAYELLSWCVMLTLNTVVFKLILQILRHFYLTPLLYKSTFLHIYPWIYQLAYLHIIAKQRFYHLVLLLTVTRRVTKQLR